MYRENKVIIIFHLLVIEGCEPIVNGYMDILMHSGLYDDCDEILFNIRYTDVRSLNSVLDIFKRYSKIKIWNIVNNDAEVSGEISKYWRKSMNSACRNGNKVSIWGRLGEIESIMELLTNVDIQDYIGDYDLGLFLNSKSMSHVTALTNPARENLAPDFDAVSDIFRKRIPEYTKCLDAVIDDDRWGEPDGEYSNIIFGFKPQWFKDVEINEYFKALKSLQADVRPEGLGNDPKVYVKCQGQFVDYTSDGNYIVKDRHIFSNFPTIMNWLMKFGFFLHLKRSELC